MTIINATQARERTDNAVAKYLNAINERIGDAADAGKQSISIWGRDTIADTTWGQLDNDIRDTIMDTIRDAGYIIIANSGISSSIDITW